MSIAKYPLRCFQTAARCSVAVFFSIFFVFGYGNALAEAATKKLELSEKTFQVSDDHSSVTSHDFKHDPSLPNEDPLEPEFPDESESKSDYDDEVDEYSHHLHPETFQRLHGKKSLLLQLRLSSNTRDKISLFVLHHSWKSFLI